jgi:hypothetical protein
MMRLNRLGEAWIAPPALRELRELLRYRAKLVQLRTGLKAQVHAVTAKEGVLPTVSDMFCAAGNRQLDAVELAAPFAHRVGSLRELIGVYDREIVALERDIHQHLKHIVAIGHCRRSMVSAGSARRSWSRRSVM